jgi:hypothetical protein
MRPEEQTGLTSFFPQGFDVVQVNFKFEGDAKALEKWQRWLDCYPKPSYRR